MKKRFLSTIIIISLLLLPFNCLKVLATQTIDESNRLLEYYRYDAKTNEVSKLTHTQICNRNSPLKHFSSFNNNTETLNTEEYIPEHLSTQVPSTIEPRGSMVEINPATGGQYRNTVYISYKKNNEILRASGFMIGPAAVVTSGHVLYSDGKYATNIVVTPARANSSSPYGSAEYSGVLVNSEWVEATNSDYDWGIIELETNIGDNVGWLGLETKTTSYNDKSIMANGYPKEVNNVIKHTMYRVNGTISSSGTYVLFSSDTPGVGGMSGGPVYYYKSGNGYTAIGLVMGKSSSGKTMIIRFTRSLYDLLVSYRDYRA